MVLARVIYELFESESDVVGLADRGEPVPLGRQLRLEFADAASVFIAWTWGALANSKYHVGWSHASFCMDAAEVEHDATRSRAWATLVGRELSLHYRDPEQQVLEVGTREDVVFCWAWDLDTLYVGRHLPGSDGDPAAASG